MASNVHKLKPDIPAPHIDAELGVPVSQRVAATLYDDFLPQLTGVKALKVWREMSSNDATVASILFAITMLAREVDWRVEPADESTQAEPAAVFLQDNITNLVHPLSDTVAQAFTAITYGFSFHETVYEQVDGQVMWHRLSHRPQDTLLKWELDEKLRPVAFVQAAAHGQTVPIPLVKGLLFRTDTTVPSGTSLLRGAYRSHMLKKRAEEHLMIGMSRNLQGLPEIMMPAEILAAGPSDKRYAAMKKIVTRVKRDEQMGILMPSDRDVNGNLLFEFKLVSPDSSPNFDQAVGVIRMFAADITATVLAQFIGLGRDIVGSKALAEPQQELFKTALGAIMDMLEDAFNRQIVHELFVLNPQFTGEHPRLVHGEIKDVDLKSFGEFMLKTSQSGASWYTGEDNDPMMVHLRDVAGINLPTEVT